MITRDSYNPLGLQLDGLGHVTRDNMEQVQPIIDELMIKYSKSFYMSPEVRLLVALGGIVATVHGANTGSPLLAQALAKAGKEVTPPKGANDL